MCCSFINVVSIMTCIGITILSIHMCMTAVDKANIPSVSSVMDKIPAVNISKLVK